ncbi:MAG: hypothetical protein QXT31_03820 [Candidatus Bathyarchaeia archaeon]
MVKLREMGFTNEEISVLTDGGWSEPTVKLYTRGSNVLDPNPKKRSLELLREMSDKGLTLNDVENTLALQKLIETKHLTIDRILEFISQVEEAKVVMKDLVEAYQNLKKVGLTIEHVSLLLSYKSSLDSFGITIDMLERFCKVTEKYGSSGEVLKALESYGNLFSLNNELSKLKSEKLRLETEINDLRESASRLQEERDKVQEELKLYNELKKEGFALDVLKNLKDLSSKYGGVKQVLTAMGKYAELKEIE